MLYCDCIQQLSSNYYCCLKNALSEEIKYSFRWEIIEIFLLLLSIFFLLYTYNAENISLIIIPFALVLQPFQDFQVCHVLSMPIRWKPKYFKVLILDSNNISQPKISSSILKTEPDCSTDWTLNLPLLPFGF
jgi:hypothetical protein